MDFPTPLKISIIIPTYNMAWSLERAVGSVLNQPYPIHEILIVDDASTDRTREVAEALQKVHPVIRYSRNSENQGAFRTLIRGVAECTGQWAVFLDADDELTLDSLMVRANRVLEVNDPDLAMVYGHVYLESPEPGNLIRNVLKNGRCYRSVLRELSLCHKISMMVQREKFLERISKAPTLRSGDDDFISVTLSKSFTIASVDAGVAIIHDHESPDRITNSTSRIHAGLIELFDCFRDEIKTELGLPVLFLWKLRILRARLNLAKSALIQKKKQDGLGPAGLFELLILKVAHRLMTHLLGLFFDRLYF
jgi:glycosyltransferase involved in cell wall biosynthesis